MTIAYLNGVFLPLSEARVSVLDRGFLFADGVYEVIPVYGGKAFRLAQHLHRLNNSLSGIQIRNPYDEERWAALVNRLIEQNKASEQFLYVQVTRGTQEQRDHRFSAELEPTVFAMSAAPKALPQDAIEKGVRLITLPDIRWRYCHLKTIALLPNVLLRQQADDQSADEAILIRDGYATECTTANFFIVENKTVITPPKGNDLLPGITRDLILELLLNNGISISEERVPKERLYKADEIWICSSTREVLPVNNIDGQPVSNGRPGSIWQETAALFTDYVEKLKRGEVA